MIKKDESVIYFCNFGIISVDHDNIHIFLPPKDFFNHHLSHEDTHLSRQDFSIFSTVIK